MWDARNSIIEGQFSDKENVRANLKTNMVKDKKTAGKCVTPSQCRAQIVFALTSPLCLCTF